MDIKLSNLLAEHLTRLEALNFSPTTIRSRVYNVRAFLAWVAERYGVVAPHHLNVAHLRSWQKALSRHRTCHGLPLRPRSINKRIECVRGFLTDLNEAGHVPTHMINALQYVKVPDLLPKALTHRQVKGLFSRLDTSTPEGYRDRTMLELLYSSGLRAAELLGLNQDDIDFSAGAVRVMGKGRKERIVPVGETALRFLESYLRGVRSLLGRGNTEPALFLDKNGNRMPYHTLRRIVQRIGKDAGLKEPLTAHVFRRSCTSELVRGNANLYHVSRMLGHESLETLKHYVKLNIADIQRTHRETHPREQDERRRQGEEGIDPNDTQPDES